MDTDTANAARIDASFELQAEIGHYVATVLPATRNSLQSWHLVARELLITPFGRLRYAQHLQRCRRAGAGTNNV